jgi:hypothetical protein
MQGRENQEQPHAQHMAKTRTDIPANNTMTPPSIKRVNPGSHALSGLSRALVFLCASSVFSMGGESHAIQLWKIKFTSVAEANPAPTATPIPTDGLAFTAYDTMEQALDFDDLRKEIHSGRAFVPGRVVTSIQAGVMLKNLGTRAQRVDMVKEGFIAMIVKETVDPRLLELTVTYRGAQTKVSIWVQEDAFFAVPDNTAHGGMGLYLVRIASAPNTGTEREEKDDPTQPLPPPG